MSHPYFHARSSARKFGGRSEDYEPIHTWFDLTKSAWADVRHRAVRHHAQGIFAAEEVFGLRERVRQLEQTLTRCQYILENVPGARQFAQAEFGANFQDTFVRQLGTQVLPTYLTRESDGKVIPLRPILEQHVVEDVGHIPTLADWLETLPREGWHGRVARRLSALEESASVTESEIE